MLHPEPVLDPSAVIASLSAPGAGPFALLRRLDPGTGLPGPVEVLRGPVTTVEHLADIPLPSGAGATRDVLALVPFRQLRERGFEVHDDATPLQVLQIDSVQEIPIEVALRALPDDEVHLRDVAPDLDDDAYADVVRRIISDEIAEGVGANFVIRRDVDGFIDGFTASTALSLFRRLLVAEQGAYWTFVVHVPSATTTGNTTTRTLVGASPEVHVRMARGEVVMNPISGTYRYPATGPDADGLVEFLTDPKEVEELFMVVDEELKMMCSVGDLGGIVHGPYLREMANLAHTEFEIRGRSTLDSREVLRQTMFAATVTGSPLQSACRVIRRYEPSGRGYYAGALALLGRDADGSQTLDSPILIRTADIRTVGTHTDGPTSTVRVSVGATLVRGSTPDGEVAETHAKSAGVLRALGALPPLAPRGASGAPARRVPLIADPRVATLLASRRDRLARFWLEPQQESAGSPLGDALVVDAEDTFTSMLVHLLASAGLQARVLRYDDPALDAELLAHRGLVVLGPGPGDPQDASDPRISRLQGLAAGLSEAAQHGGNPLLGVCLGHQLLSGTLGLPLRRKDTPHQGTQFEVDLFGAPATVGFYNSFTARVDDAALARLARRGVEVATGPSDEVVALRGDGFAGIQFHPESVLTLDGPAVLRSLVEPLLKPLLAH
ncbi:MAG: anthranilate synthase family protein [Janthinobacterium lividum]